MMIVLYLFLGLIRLYLFAKIRVSKDLSVIFIFFEFSLFQTNFKKNSNNATFKYNSAKLH